MEIVSLKQRPQNSAPLLCYLQQHWATQESAKVYENCLAHALDKTQPLPQWYALMDGGRVVGCAGSIPNDFISRMDLWPWICALSVEPAYRSQGWGRQLIGRAVHDAGRAGYPRCYLCTGIEGFYEACGFSYLGQGYHPWGESSRIYAIEIK